MELWIPSGGHVEPDEHPTKTVLRELKEELFIEGVFIQEAPLFLTSTMTVGKTPGHTDVSLWYLMRGDRSVKLRFDTSEFHEVRWFHKSDIPLLRCDPHMARFLKKLYRS